MFRVFRSSVKESMNKRAARSFRDFESHSPMFRNRHFNEERRSRLFTDRPFIYGRWPKYLIAWCLSMQFWAGYYLYYKHSHNAHLQQRTIKANRRTVPFVQAMEDIRFIAIQERNYMILKSICDRADPRLFSLFRSRYNQEDLFVSYYVGTTMRNYYDGRIGRSRFFNMKANRVPEDETGLVSTHEQSIYG